MKFPFSLLCATLLGWSTLSAQHFSVGFRIYDPDDFPLQGAVVSLSEGDVNALSDSLGTVNLTVNTFRTHYSVSILSFQTVSGIINLSSDTIIHIKMQRKPINLSESVITARVPDRDESNSLSINVTNYEILKRTQGITLTQTLEKSSGITSMNIGAGISKPFLRGMGFNRLAVVENGIKQQGQQWGADHGLEIDAFNVGRVAIIKGPSSLRYGSDAIAGVIEIYPTPLPESNSFQTEVIIQGMSVNSLAGGSAGFAINRNHYYVNARASYKSYSDYTVPADSFYYNGWKLPIYNHKLKNTAGRETDASFSAGYIGKRLISSITMTGFWLKAGFFSGAHGLPGFRNTLPDTGNRDIDLPLQEVNHYKIESNCVLRTLKGNFSLDAAYQQNLRMERSYPHTHGRGPQPLDDLELMFRLQTLTLNVRMENEISEKISYETGLCIEYQWNKHQGYMFLLPDFTQLNIGVYTSVSYQPSKMWNINAGIRTDYFRIEVQKHLEPVYFSPDSISYYIQKSPDILKNYATMTFNAGFSWVPTDKWNLKFNIGSGFRIPSAIELASNGIHHGSFRHESGDSLLVPEHSYQADLGVYFQSLKTRISVTPFVNFIKDYIYLKPTGTFSPLAEAGQLYKYSATDALMIGLEAGIRYSLFKWLGLEIHAQYVLGQNLNDGYPLPFVPPLQIHPFVTFEFVREKGLARSLYFQLAAWYNSPQLRTARNEETTSSSFTMDLSAGISILRSKNQISFRVNASNLFNTSYYNHLSYYRIINLPEPGRNISLSIQWNFNKTFKTENL